MRTSGAALAAALTLAGCGVGDDDPELQKIGAENACQDWVREQLRAPSTATFSDVSASGVGPWQVTGEVEAQNGFGGTERLTWSCDVRLDGDTFRGRAAVG